MIIKCEQCKTKFRLDDSKVTEKGVKVRCAKCKHVFSVKKEVEEQPQPLLAATDPIPQTPEQTLVEAGEQPKPATDIFQTSSPSFAFDDYEHESQPSDMSGSGSAQLDSTPLDSPPASVTSQPEDGFDFSDSPAETVFTPETQAEPAQAAVKFDDFDFGHLEHSDAEVSVPDSSGHMEDISDLTGKITTPQENEEAADSAQNIDFSDDEMFGKVVTPVDEEQGDPISFDFGDDSFADAMDLGKTDTELKNELVRSDSTGETPFSLDDIDFGDELTSVAVQQVNPEELKTSQKNLFSPLAEAEEKKADEENSAFGSILDGHEELPPLPISSRRKQSSFFTWLISGIAVLVAAGLGYFGFTTMSTDKGSAAKESGKISVRSIMAAYVQNPSIGKLLVISGEAVNEYPLPRAALQVKGSIVNSAGQGVASKTAYCGNPLSADRLSTMTLENIESAMANQFGDSLSNLEVAPGKTIPFTIVIPKPPADGKDFTVEPAGSTVASGKQQ